MTNKQLIQITASTHFPIRLTPTNFPVWRKQVQSTLIGLELESFIDVTQKSPSQTLADNKPNPEYLLWYRQDHVIISAILGSCSDSIQPLISSAVTALDAWNRLNSSYASASRSRIISLKSKLVKNPKGSRPVQEFLQDMRTIDDDLALAQSPIAEEDLLVHIISQLGDEYNNIVAVIKVRETPLSYPKLYDKLIDFERSLKETVPSVDTAIPTANYTTQQGGRIHTTNSFQRNQRPFTSGQQRPQGNMRSKWPTSHHNTRPNRNTSFCQFCTIPGHTTQECRKLSRFLKDNNISLSHSQASSPVANVTTADHSSPISPPWLFDTGASHHVTSDRSVLHNVSEYGGPDEITLGDGTGSTHGGASHAG